MGDQPLEIKINLNVELWFGETNDDQEMDFNRTRNCSYRMSHTQVYLKLYVQSNIPCRIVLN